MLTVKRFTFNPLGENTYVVYDDRRHCAVIDPGCSTNEEQNILANYIAQERLTPVLLLNTHCHVDHVPGNAFVADTYQVPLMIHEWELPLLRDAPHFGRFFGLHCPPSPEPTAFLKEGDEVNIGSGKMRVLFTPGHSPGSISFYCEKAGWIIVGDVLFLGSVGRYDLPGANGETLFQTIENRLLCLPDNITVYSGHGPETTIGHERKTNPFLNKNFREVF